MRETTPRWHWRWTARLVAVHTELFLDLPKDVGLTWSPLLAVTGSIETFEEPVITAMILTPS